MHNGKMALPALSVCLLMAHAAVAAQEAPVGQPPQDQPSAIEAASSLDDGLLTQRRRFTVEPSLEYIHSTSTQVAIEGFTIIPALAIGLFNVREVQRDSATAALAFRYGLTRRLEAGVRFPYVYRKESVRERQIFEGSSLDIVRDSEGDGLGDVEMALHYTFNPDSTDALYVGNLRVKSRTGTSPFEVDRELLTDADGNVIGEVLKEQPTGSGFWGVQPSLTAVFPSEPAVLYTNFSYLWNVKRDLGEGIGEVDPGDAVGLSFGLGLAVNDRTSFTLGYDHSVVLKTKFENDSGIEPVFDRIHVGSFLFGFSNRMSSGRYLNVSLGVGVTSAAPDVRFGLRLPYQF